MRKILLILIFVLLLGFVAVQLFALKSQYAIETHKYHVENKFDDIEIRTYQKALFSTTKLPTNNFEEASSKGFSILAGYIFGANDRNEKIAMTSPVTMSLQDSSYMLFMIPEKFKKEDLPTPNNSKIKFQELPEKMVAAITFGGWANEKKIEKYKLKLISALNKKGFPHTNQFLFLGYNAPYEVFNRKNEIVVELRNVSY